MRIHFIAIGGSAMHNLALALHDQGHQITGSDDEIYEPSRGRLLLAGLLPSEYGWYTEKIVPTLDAIILGMHAKKDNPELLRAIELNIPVYSYPEFVFNLSKNKQRIAIAGSHGKTTTTSIIMHVLKFFEIDFDYLVGAQIEGFDRMVRLSDAPFIIIEGDEYLSSPIDRRPKMLHYRPHIAVITGIAWDHINVFPTFEDYKNQFALFMDSMEPNGNLIYYEKDEHINAILDQLNRDFTLEPYDEIEVKDGFTKVGEQSYKIHLIGSHNRQNIDAALRICRKLDISDLQFYKALESFTGARKRLQQLGAGSDRIAYLDFAHAPSKVLATTNAVAETYPDKRLLAVFELHTFSSLNESFLPEYLHTLNGAHSAIVYVSKHTLEMKGMKELNADKIKAYFDHPNLSVIMDSEVLEQTLRKFVKTTSVNFLLMSSGTFSGIDLSFLRQF